MSIAEAMTVTRSAPMATLRCNQHACAKRRIQPGARSTSPATGLSVLIVFIEIHGRPGPRQPFQVMSRPGPQPTEPAEQNRPSCQHHRAARPGRKRVDVDRRGRIDDRADRGRHRKRGPDPARSIASSTARTIHSPKTNHRMTERAPAIDEPVSSATPAPSSAHRPHARMPAAQMAKRSVVKLKSRPKSNIAPMLTTSTANA